MKLCFPQARHVVCAYYLQDLDHQPHYDCDYCDDEEPGAGRVIANLLRANKISHRVIFVIRYCGSVKLSSKRFDMYREAAIEAIKAGAWNEILKKMQKISEDTVLHPSKKPQPAPKPQRMTNDGHFRGRGRGSNMPMRGVQSNQQSKSKQRDHLLDSSAKRGSSTPRARRDAIYHPQYQDKSYAAITSQKIENSFMFAKPMLVSPRVEDQDSLD